MVLFSLQLLFYTFLWFFWRDYMFISFDQIWTTTSSAANAIDQVWFVFAWGTLATLVISVYGKGEKRLFQDPLTGFLKGLWLSINAGFFEEMIYRWLAFSTAMVLTPFLNWITFGLVHWLNVQVLLPVANWSTLGYLEPQLLSNNWVLGAAILTANASFRDEHKQHLGLLGYVNSWFGGMLMFYLMFHYGIWAAIAVHTVYDICVFSTESAVSTYYDAKNSRSYRPSW